LIIAMAVSIDEVEFAASGAGDALIAVGSTRRPVLGQRKRKVASGQQYQTGGRDSVNP
jgi:hypothetical protein